MSVLIEFNVIYANNLVDNALLFNGENQVFGWASHVKQNHPLFAAGGKHNVLAKNFNILMDRDYFDCFVFDPDHVIGTEFGGY